MLHVRHIEILRFPSCVLKVIHTSRGVHSIPRMTISNHEASSSRLLPCGLCDTCTKSQFLRSDTAPQNRCRQTEARLWLWMLPSDDQHTGCRACAAKRGVTKDSPQTPGSAAQRGSRPWGSRFGAQTCLFFGLHALRVLTVLPFPHP